MVTNNPTIKAIGFSFAAGVFLDAFVVRLTLVPAVMAIIGSRLWYHPRWFARRVPDPDIEGHRLERELAEAELVPVGTSAREGYGPAVAAGSSGERARADHRGTAERTGNPAHHE